MQASITGRRRGRRQPTTGHARGETSSCTQRNTSRKAHPGAWSGPGCIPCRITILAAASNGSVVVILDPGIGGKATAWSIIFEPATGARDRPGQRLAAAADSPLPAMIQRHRRRPPVCRTRMGARPEVLWRGDLTRAGIVA